MKHALIVSPTASHPVTQGSSARITNLCRLLQERGYFVHFLYYTLDGPEVADIQAMSAAWDFVYRYPADYARIRMSLPSHFAIDDWWDPRVGDLACHLDGLWRFDLCIANYVWFAAVLDYLPERVAKFIDTHDVFADRAARAAAAGVNASWFFTNREEEARGLARADTVLAIQDEEAGYFRQLGHPRVETLGLVMPRNFLPARPRSARLRLGYIGSDNPWNVRTIRLFHAELAARPALLSRLDPVIAGPIAAAIAGFNRIFTPLGTVADPGDFYGDVDLVVNPMTGGTGLKIKSVEAMSFGVPLISTADGSVGIGSRCAAHRLHDISAVLDTITAVVQSDRLLAALREQSRRIFLDYTARQLANVDRLFRPDRSSGSS